MNKNYKEMYDSIEVSVQDKENMKRMMEQELRRKNGTGHAAHRKSGAFKVVIVCVAAVVICLAGTGAYTVQAETSYITVTSSAKIGLSVNRWNKVIKAEAVNEEAKAVLENVEVKGCDYDEAVELILQYEQEHGYIADSDSFTISVNCNNEEHAGNMQKKIDEKCSQGQYHKYGQTKVNEHGSGSGNGAGTGSGNGKSNSKG